MVPGRFVHFAQNGKFDIILSDLKTLKICDKYSVSNKKTNTLAMIKLIKSSREGHIVIKDNYTNILFFRNVSFI